MIAHDDTAWLCWRYLLGELEAAEAAAFEDRVAADEQVALALAEAARVHQALLLGQPDIAKARLRQADGLRRAALLAVAATIAAVVCGLSAVRWMGGTATPTTDIVALWTAADSADPDPDEMPEDLDDAAGDDVPAWLVAAVSIRAHPPVQEP